MRFTTAVQKLYITATLCSILAHLQGDLKLMARLLKAGADVNAGDYDKRTPLHIAAAEVNLTAVSSKALPVICGRSLVWTTLDPLWCSTSGMDLAAQCGCRGTLVAAGFARQPDHLYCS